MINDVKLVKKHLVALLKVDYIYLFIYLMKAVLVRLIANGLYHVTEPSYVYFC